MRSDLMKKGLEKAPHRSLMKAVGLTDEEIARPLVGIANSWNEIVPGHTHLRDIVEAVKAGVRIAGGTPLEFGVIGACDGLAMNHPGMKYSLAEPRADRRLRSRSWSRRSRSTRSCWSPTATRSSPA